MAAVTVSNTDVTNFNLQGEITALGNLVTAANSAGNFPLAMSLTRKQVQKQNDLVASLMGCGSISSATILAGNAVTYALPPWQASGRAPVI